MGGGSVGIGGTAKRSCASLVTAARVKISSLVSLYCHVRCVYVEDVGVQIKINKTKVCDLWMVR